MGTWRGVACRTCDKFASLCSTCNLVRMLPLSSMTLPHLHARTACAHRAVVLSCHHRGTTRRKAPSTCRASALGALCLGVGVGRCFAVFAVRVVSFASCGGVSPWRCVLCAVRSRVDAAAIVCRSDACASLLEPSVLVLTSLHMDR